MKSLVDKLTNAHTLNAEEYRRLLLCENKDSLSYLQAKARETSIARFGRKVYIRGLIETTNRCHNDCLYCGIRRSNTNVVRYALSPETILQCCREGYALGFRTFVLQGGEDLSQTSARLEKTTRDIRREFPDCAITLSFGEMERDDYQRLFDAGANRYLLRHETFNAGHYRSLHPSEMNREHRLQCLQDLKDIGYQVGTGIMVGSPGQTVGHLVEDLLFIERFRPEMIGIGPFIPHKDTPFANQPAGSIGMTLKLLAIFRLMHPSALIPATTALATLAPDGTEQSILAGANVVMPNLSPASVRKQYTLYNNKAAFGSEAAEGLQELKERLERIGYEISKERGDYEL